MMSSRASLLPVALMLMAGTAGAGEFRVGIETIGDPKAVFATVESRTIVPARARIGGMIAELTVREGDRVERGRPLAFIGDEKLVLQIRSLDAQIAGLDATAKQAQADFSRAESLFEKGTIARARFDESRTALNVATNALRARSAERSVIQQQLSEGRVIAPSTGRVLRVPLTTGTVVMPGEAVATIADEHYVLRLRVPERHARGLKPGDTIRIDGSEIDQSGARFGTIRLVYPQIEDGRVVADAEVEGLADSFVGERIRVWLSSGDRKAIIVPSASLMTRYGMDYVTVKDASDKTELVPVQRGRPLPRPHMPDGIEILSGLSGHEVLITP